MCKNKYGFTISEMLIAMAIIGIVGAILTPILARMLPSQNKVMFKRTYYLVTNTVSKMLEGDTFYSSFGAVGSGNETTPIYEGFDNKDLISYNGREYSGDTKFSGLFTEIIGARNAGTESIAPVFKLGSNTYTASAASSPVAVSKDGVKWVFYTPKDASWSNVASIILIDVNGSKAPNCYQGESGGCVTRTKDFDQYLVAVLNNGKVAVNLNDVWVQSVLDASSSVGAN